MRRYRKIVIGLSVLLILCLLVGLGTVGGVGTGGMAYAVVNKSGCGVHKGNCQIRLDFYLESEAPRYNERYLYLVDVTSVKYLTGYLGKVDEEGNPINQEDYDNWWESLPRVWENTPFHSHFVYLSADFTQEDIKREIETHLANFYTAFQAEWDKVDGGMRHGWTTETRITPTDYSKTESAISYQARVTECQAAIDSLAEFVYKPEGEIEGKEFPATEIDMGSAAINRATDIGDSYTYIDKANAANDTGTIDTFETWARSTMDGTNKVGTFHGAGTDYTNRDGEVIGEVTAGAKRTFTGLDIDVSTGDFAGIYFSAGEIEADTTGGSDIYRVAGDQFGTGQQTYVQRASDAMSLYGTGETVGAVGYSFGTIIG